MTLKIVETITSAAELEKESVIKILERALEEARLGKIVSVALAYVRPGSLRIGSAFSVTNYGGALIGAVELTRYRLLKNIENED